jgi:hypothetical protein
MEIKKTEFSTKVDLTIYAKAHLKPSDEINVIERKGLFYLKKPGTMIGVWKSMLYKGEVKAIKLL